MKIVNDEAERDAVLQVAQGAEYYQTDDGSAFGVFCLKHSKEDDKKPGQDDYRDNNNEIDAGGQAKG